MIRFNEILLPEHVLLDLSAKTREEAVYAVAKSLQGDDRIRDWADFYKTLSESERSIKCNLELGLTIPHTRTEAVTAMVMAFGRLATPLVLSPEEIRYVLIIGIPKTMDADYLRLVGVLMRVFRYDDLRAALDSAASAQAVLKVFSAGETELES
jgi:mannitol/fructose-specific phosphotransferase system IIA component (Ntr-type)